MKQRTLFTVLTLVCAGILSAQTLSSPLPVDTAVRIGKLDNGLTYYIRHNGYPEKQADFYIAQKVGSIQEEEHQRGLAHFLEHMCFNGTKNFPGKTLISYLESIGVKFGDNLNAYTSIDETVYNIDNVPVTREGIVDSCLLILHDWSNALTLDGKEIDEERSVIHEEWRSRSNATMRMYEKALPILYPDNNIYGRRLPIGLMSVVDSFPHEALRAYYHKWYRPDLQAIIVVGDVDVDAVEKKIHDLFTHIPLAANAAKRVYPTVPDNYTPLVFSGKDKEQTRATITIARKHETYPDSLKNTPLYYIHNYLVYSGLSMLSSRLNEKALQPGCPYTSASCSEDTYEMSKTKGAFYIYISPKEGQWKAAIDTVMAEVTRAYKYGFTATEYDRTRTEWLSQLDASYEGRNKRKNSSFTRPCIDHFLNKEPLASLETEYELMTQLIPNLTADLVDDTFRSIAAPSDTNLVVYSMAPDKEGYKVPTETELLNWVKEGCDIDLGPFVDKVKNEPLIASLPTPGRIIKEKPGRFGTTHLVLSNGVKVILKPTDYKDNEILMQAYSPGGDARYPESDVANLLLFDRLIKASGLGNFTRTELNKALAGVQANVQTSLSSRSEQISGAAVPKDLRTLFELVYLSFGKPLRDDASVEAVMHALGEQLKRKEAQPTSAISDSMMVTLYDHNPRVRNLHCDMLDQVSYDRILEIYADRFADASDFTFTFCGKFDTDSIRPLIEQYLATLPTVRRNDKPVDGKTYMHKGAVTNRFLRPMETPQGMAVLLWHGGMPYNLKNNLVINTLGQILDTRYTETVREELGAAYSVGVVSNEYFSSADKPGYFIQVFAPLKPELCDTALVVMKSELEKIARNGVEKQYIDKIKEYLLKQADEQVRNNGYWLHVIQTYAQRGLDSNTDLKRTIESITSKDIQKMARRIMKDNNHIRIIMLPKEDKTTDTTVQ